MVMTAQDVIDRLFTAKGVTRERVLKAQGLAQRLNMDWSLVLAAMSDTQRKQVQDVG